MGKDGRGAIKLIVVASSGLWVGYEIIRPTHLLSKPGHRVQHPFNTSEAC